MDSTLAQQAIQAAIQGDWHTAQRLNRKIIESNPNDIEGLLRFANATAQLGDIRQAIALYEKILDLDPHNIFATKALSRLKNVKTRANSLLTSPHILVNTFLEEPGKTKTTILVRPAYSEVLAQIDTGEKVILSPRRRRISVTSQTGVYIGRLPDDLSIRLLNFIRGGNEYEAVIKSINGDVVKVFIREVSRSSRFEDTPSFPPEHVVMTPGE